MKIYLCGRFGRRAELAEYAQALAEDGHEITATWLCETSANDQDLTPQECQGAAKLDTADIDRSDLVLVFSEAPDSPYGRGGRHFETGYAYAKGKRIVVVGPLENVFHYADGIRYAPDFEKARVGLKLLSCTMVSQS